MGNDRASKTEAQSLIIEIQLTPVDISSAVEKLSSEGFVEANGEEIILSAKLDTDVEFLASFIRRFLQGIVITKALGSPWLDNHINAVPLLDEVCRVQRGSEAIGSAGRRCFEIDEMVAYRSQQCTDSTSINPKSQGCDPGSERVA